MGIEAGKFFVNLGLTGAEKTVSGLAQVNDHFAGLKGISTEAKLAILAALAGLEQMVSMTGKFGNETMKTHQHLMVSIHDLQLYEAMAHNAGAATGSMTTMFESVQNAMESLKLEGKASQFMPVLMALMQGNGTQMSPDQIVKWGSSMGGPVQFTEALMKLIRNYKGKQADLNFMIQQSGLMPQDIYDVNRMGAFSESKRKIAEKQLISDKDVQNLNTLNTEWNKTIGMMEKFAKLFATELVPAVEDLYKVSELAVGALEKWQKYDAAMQDKPLLARIFGPTAADQWEAAKHNTGPIGAHKMEITLKSDGTKEANIARNGAHKALHSAGYNSTVGKLSSTKVGQ